MFLNLFDLQYPPCVEIIKHHLVKILEYENITYMEVGDGTYVEIMINKEKYFYSYKHFYFNKTLLPPGGYYLENELIKDNSISPIYIKQVAHNYFYPLSINRCLPCKDIIKTITLNLN